MRKFKHLRGAMTNLSASGAQGLCIHRSAALVLDLPGSKLCFGVFRAATVEERIAEPNASPEPFIHCWVEYRGEVYAPTTIERFGKLVALNRDEYYRANGVTGVRYLLRPQLLRVSKEIGLASHLLVGKPARCSVGGALLDAAGVSYRISELGGLVPA